MDREVFWADIQSAHQNYVAPRPSREALKVALQSPGVRDCLKEAYLSCRAIPNRMLTNDFTKEDGVLVAAQMQGEALGWTRCIETLLDMVESLSEEQEHDDAA